MLTSEGMVNLGSWSYIAVLRGRWWKRSISEVRNTGAKYNPISGGFFFFQNVFEQDKACKKTVRQCSLAHLPCELQIDDIYTTVTVWYNSKHID